MNIGWILLAAFVLLGTLCLIRAIYETHRLDISQVELGSGKKQLKVVFFSDLHVNDMYVKHETLFKNISAAKADLILFAGDMTNGEALKTKMKAINFLSNVNRIAKEQSIPFFSVNGNHDLFGLDKELSDKGVCFLANESVVVTGKDQSEWILAGLEDLRMGNPDYHLATSRTLTSHTQHSSGSCQSSPPVLVLAHNPDTIFKLPAQDLAGKLFLLSGHFHGGQIWMPFNLEYKILRTEKLADLGYRKGSFQYRGIIGFISRGIGCVIFPLRFFSYPELTILTLRSD
jgi:uncharacterized protein